MLLYYIIFVAVAVVVVVVVVVVVFYMLLMLEASHLLLCTFAQIFQHSLECSLECSLMLLMQCSVHGLLSISSLLMEGRVRRLVQSRVAT